MIGSGALLLTHCEVRTSQRAFATTAFTKEHGPDDPALGANASPKDTHPICRLPLATWSSMTIDILSWRPDAVVCTALERRMRTERRSSMRSQGHSVLVPQHSSRLNARLRKHNDGFTGRKPVQGKRQLIQVPDDLAHFRSLLRCHFDNAPHEVEPIAILRGRIMNTACLLTHPRGPTQGLLHPWSPLGF